MNLYSNSYTRNESLLFPEDALLLLVDIQERYRPAIHGMEALIRKNKLLLQVARRLDIPVIVTEQYPKGLGQTVKSLSLELPEHTPIFSKLSMSALADDVIYDALKNSKKRQIVVTGIESHVCIMQTVMDLMANFDGWVYVVQDAVSSRSQADHETALGRMQGAGAHLVTSEMVAFEWVQKAGSQVFKDIQNLLR